MELVFSQGMSFDRRHCLVGLPEFQNNFFVYEDLYLLGW
jgi:hypothetical protein